MRNGRYRFLREFFRGQEGYDIEDPDSSREGLRTVTLTETSHAVGKQLQDLTLDEFEVTVTAVRRDGKRGLHPRADTQLQEGDVVVLYGTPEAIERAGAILLSGLDG